MWPDLERLNKGNEFDETSPVTPDIFNMIVQALKYLKAQVN